MCVCRGGVGGVGDLIKNREKIYELRFFKAHAV